MLNSFISYRVRFMQQERLCEAYFDDSDQAEKFAEKQKKLIGVDKVLILI